MIHALFVTGNTPSCVTFTNLTESVAMVTDTVMTRTVCVQFCKGQDITYASVRYDVCFCYNDLPTHIAHANDACSTACPGSPFQYCGGPTTDQFTIIEGFICYETHCLQSKCNL